MLFTQHTSQLQANITTIQTRIDELEELLKALRNDKANLEAELQTVLTLEGAAESALNQSQAFITAAESLNRTDLIETFWTALDGLKQHAIAQLPTAEPEPGTEPETAPEPPAPTQPSTDESVEVAVTLATPEPDTTPEPTNGKALINLSAAVFDPSTSDLGLLKRYVRSHWDDSKTKQYGSLTMRKTWQMAAKAILEGK